MTKSHFEARGDARVDLYIRPSNDVYYKVHDHRFLLTHDDILGVKGGDGIIGSLGPIARGEVKMRGSSASAGMEYDTLLMGHWHQQLWLPRAIVANTLKGFDEYARLSLRATPSAPSQPLWFMHPTRGFTSRWDIKADAPKAPPLAAVGVRVRTGSGGVRMLYFAHPISDYDTVHERACLDAIEAAFSPLDCEIRVYNTNSPEGARGYRDHGMAFFERVIGTCSALVYRAFGDGAIGAGVATEIACAVGLGLPVHELVETTRDRLVVVPVIVLNVSRVLDVEQARARLVGRRTAA